MRLKIAARKSDLARLQAYRVGQALSGAHPQLQIEYLFKESLGDKNLQDPLWQLPEKGVFTEDFHQDLLTGAADLVVHSWKDLPTVEKQETQIAATLPRADQRDLLLVKSSTISKVQAAGLLRIMSSSPRRSYNLAPFLQQVFPRGKNFAPELQVEFCSVRGNIPTRLSKLLQSTEAQGLIVAKAALDRLLSAPEEEFSSAQVQIRQCLQQCHWMVLPLSVNPNAAGQGALAIEILRTRQDLQKLLAAINDPVTFQAVSAERQVLARYGGGCHQKIGVAILPRFYGEVHSLRGLTDSGEKLHEYAIHHRSPAAAAEIPAKAWPQFLASEMWSQSKQLNWQRQTLPWAGLPASINALFIAKSEAWPADWMPAQNYLVWTAGISSWKKLAQRGIWVHGCTDSLGEDEALQIETLQAGGFPAGAERSVPLRWAKLTHEQGQTSPDKEKVATYRLLPLPQQESQLKEQFKGKKCFYWMSGSAFLQALQQDLHTIQNGHHACGPGHTYKIIQQTVKNMPQQAANLPPVQIFISEQEWKKTCQI